MECYATCTAIQLLGAPIKLIENLIRGYKKSVNLANA